MSPAGSSKGGGGGEASRAVILIRILVGWFYLFEGIEKFMFSDRMASGQFHRLGIPAPHAVAILVAVLEILCGVAVLVGIETRWAAGGLLLVNLGAIAATKLHLFRHDDIWTALHQSRLEISLFLAIVFLMVAGSGAYALENRRG